MRFWRRDIWMVICLAGVIECVRAADLPDGFPPHPRLLFNSSDLADIKERATGRYTAAFESLKGQAQEWLKREVKLPDRGGQWFHWYSCPKHGARLRAESPTRHVCPVDQEVFSGYPYDDVVISAEHNRLAAAIRTLGIVYQMTGDPRYAQKAKTILLAYAAKYQGYPLHDIHGKAKVGGGKVGPQTLDESTWLITVVEGADCIWDTLTSPEQQQVKEGLLFPATEVIRKHKMGIHNIQCWKNSAVGLTALLLGDRDLLEEALNGQSGYHNQMAKGVTADGPWFEGAWGYHFYTLSAVLHLTEGAYHSGINLYGPELKRMLDAPLVMAMPDLQLPAFNDSQEVDLATRAGIYETAFARYKDNTYLLVTGLDRGAAEGGLLHGAPAVDRAPQFEALSRNFAASGNAILAAGAGTGATWLCIKYGPHGGGHGHPDKLNFVLYGFGQVLAPDPGTANYGVPIQGGWFRTTLAHNTLTADEKSQKPAQGTCEAFLTTNGLSAVMTSAGPIYEGVTFHRTVALIATNLVVFLDQIQSEREHVYDLVYHNRGKFVDLPEAVTFEPPDKPGYSYLRDTKARVSTSAQQFRFDLGGGQQVHWACAGGEETTYIAGTGVGRHTEDRVPLIISRRKCKSTSFLWCVSLGTADDQLELQAQDVKMPGGGDPAQGALAAVRIKTASGVRVVVANAAGTAVMVGDQRVQGHIALLAQGETGKLQLRFASP